MRRFSDRFRVLLLTLALGLARVNFFSNLYDRWRDSINLPQVKSDSVIYVYPKRILTESILQKREFAAQKRDLSLYDICNYKTISESRAFIWKHWKAKKRGYIGWQSSGRDLWSETDIFIEPDKTGEWHLVWIRKEPGSFIYPLMIPDVVKISVVHSVEFKQSQKRIIGIKKEQFIYHFSMKQVEKLNPGNLHSGVS